MQPTKLPRSARSSGESRSSATTSLIPIRPPGLSTRAISVSTAGLSVERLITQFEITTSTESAGSGISSITPLRKIGVADPGLPRVRAGEREHLVGHVEPERESGRADPLRGQDHVDAAARAEIEDGLALVQVGDHDRVAAAERGERRGLRQLAALLGVVERLTELGRVALAVAAGAAATAAWRSFADRSRRLGVAAAHFLAQLVCPVVVISNTLPSGRRRPRASRPPRASARSRPTCRAAHARAGRRRRASSDGGTRSAARDRPARSGRTRRPRPRSGRSG